jgi:pimeloyl-ACP methyl ester carboxylesterase
MMVTTASNTVTKRKRNWMKRTLWTLVILVILASIGSVGLATYVGWNLTHPAHEPLKNVPETYGISYENVKMTSSDQLKLDGWLFQSKQSSNKLIVFAHGYANNRSHEVGSLPLVKALLDAGYDCLMFDFRNSGLSEGELTSIGLFEKLDLLAAVDYGKSLGYENFGLVGFSMGAATTALAAAESSDVDALVMDSSFAALRPYLEENLPVWSHLPAFPFTPLVLWVTPMLIGVDADLVRPIDAMAKLQDRGVLLIHAKEDGSIPATNSEQLYEAVGDTNAELWLTDSKDHVGSYEVDPELYIEKIIDLFDRYVK